MTTLLSRAETHPEGAKPLPVQVRVHNLVRYGRELDAMGLSDGANGRWLNEMVKQLGHDLPDDVSRVLSAPTFGKQLQILENIAQRYAPSDRLEAHISLRRDVAHGGQQAA